MRTRIKICGITRVEDARAAAQGGADAIGLVFYPPSPRCLSLDWARELAREVPPFVSSVALFVNPSAAEVHEVLDRAGMNGEIDPSEFRRYGSARKLYNFHVDNAGAY